MTERELYERYHKDIYRTCRYMLKNPHDAEDVCQEVFIKVLQYDYTKIASLKPWMLSIAMNACRNHIRKHARISLGQEVMDWITGLVDSKRVEEQVERKLERQHIGAYIHRLKPKLREVILLKYLHELKNEEIAGIAGIPLGTVKSRANKGIGQLRRMMEAEEDSTVGWTETKEVFKG